MFNPKTPMVFDPTLHFTPEVGEKFFFYKFIVYFTALPQFYMFEKNLVLMRKATDNIWFSVKIN